MHNTMWAAVAGSIFEMRRLDAIANNLANVNTPGFRGDRVEFSTYLAQVRQREFNSYRQQLRDINELIRPHTSFAPGMAMETGNPLDLSIAGTGFFVIDSPDGPQYTRSGDFRLDPAGQLVTSDGLPVQGVNGPIVLREGLPMVIGQDGVVSQEGNEVGRIRVVEIENPDTLAKVGGRRFQATAATRVMESENLDLLPGTLEGSNVNLVREMTNLVQAGRAFEAYQRIIGMINEINKAANSRLPQVG